MNDVVNKPTNKYEWRYVYTSGDVAHNINPNIKYMFCFLKKAKEPNIWNRVKIAFCLNKFPL